MARYTDAKCKICRREGGKLFLKGKKCHTVKCPIERKGAAPPGEPAKRVRKRATDYGSRLREKQRLKRAYGLLEAQFRRYVKEAERAEEDFGVALLRRLEARLDNVIRRLGYCWSLNQARQLVAHGHVLVDEARVDIPSYNVRQGQVIHLTDKARKLPFVQEALQEISAESIPPWLTREGDVGKVLRLPSGEELPDEFDLRSVAEFY